MLISIYTWVKISKNIESAFEGNLLTPLDVERRFNALIKH